MITPQSEKNNNIAWTYTSSTLELDRGMLAFWVLAAPYCHTRNNTIPKDMWTSNKEQYNLYHKP